jgi:pimeloyl-ACP methyl ester carboxylesterase
MARSRDGIEIAFTTCGSEAADAVVLVHGWLGNRTYWAQQIEILAERYRVIALDLAGHGESGLGRDDWTLEAFGGDVTAVVDEVGPAKVALVGHSMGGDAIVFAARELGDRVTGLVWVDAFRSLGHETPATPEAIEAFVAPFRDDFAGSVDSFARGMFPASADSGLIDRIATDMSAGSVEMGVGSFRYALNREPAILEALPHIHAPKVAINPDIAPTDVGSLHDYGFEAIVLDNVGHFLMLEDPARFNPVLVEALRSFDR